MPPREVEIKLELTAAQHQRLRKRKAVRGFRTSTESDAKLVTSYFDTREWALRRSGISLRVREIDGRMVQGIKADRRVSGGLSSAEEVECEIDGNIPDIKSIPDKRLRRKLERMIGAAPLVLQFVTDIERHQRRLEGEGGEAAELAIDQGWIVAGNATEQIAEVEIELKSGHPEFLIAIAKAITNEGPMTLGTRTKADRGARLAGGPTEEAAVAGKPDFTVLSRDEETAAVIRKLLALLANTILQNWSCFDANGDTEAIHQLRVSSRRMRAALRLVAQFANDDGIAELAVELRDLARTVGSLRDIDVLAADIIAEPSHVRNARDGLARLAAHLRAEREQALTSVMETLATGRLGGLRLRLGLIAEACDAGVETWTAAFDVSASEFADACLARSLNRVLKRGHHLSELDVEQRHELRKSLKSFRYATDFFAHFYPDARMKALLKQTQKLQDILGYLNDVAIAESLLDAHVNASKEPDMRYATGVVLGWHTACAETAWADVKPVWKQFQKASKFIAE